MTRNLPYIAKYAGPTIVDATKALLREYSMTGYEIGSGRDCAYTFIEWADFVHDKVGDDIWSSLKVPTSSIYKAVAEYRKEKIYHVEYIISSNGQQGRDRLWLVKWQGYDDFHNSWEPLENFVNPALTEAFDSYERPPLEVIDLGYPDTGSDSDDDPIGGLSDEAKIAHLFKEVDTRDDKIHRLRIKLARRDDKIYNLKEQLRERI